MISKTGPAGANGKDGKNGKDGTPADLAPEAVKLVQPSVANCSAHPGSFCRDDYDNPFENYGSGYTPVGFFKDAGGFVHLQGLAHYSSGSGSGPTPDFIYLPAGYRPTDAKHEFVAEGCGGTLRGVDILTNGEVRWISSPCLSLDGIVFRP